MKQKIWASGQHDFYTNSMAMILVPDMNVTIRSEGGLVQVACILGAAPEHMALEVNGIQHPQKLKAKVNITLPNGTILEGPGFETTTEVPFGVSMLRVFANSESDGSQTISFPGQRALCVEEP